MLKPKPGDIFLVPVPFQDDIFSSKHRPAVILRDEGNGFFLMAPITGTNLTGKQVGIWIIKTSSEGVAMKLQKDSFILLEKGRLQKFPSYALSQYWGHCPCLEELLTKLR